METTSVIATRTTDNGEQMDKLAEDEDGQAEPRSNEESYEVRRSQPRHGDSYMGGLDILTVHRMLEEQNAEIEASRSKAS
jgi:hypothetical protein